MSPPPRCCHAECHCTWQSISRPAKQLFRAHGANCGRSCYLNGPVDLGNCGMPRLRLIATILLMAAQQIKWPKVCNAMSYNMFSKSFAACIWS